MNERANAEVGECMGSFNRVNRFVDVVIRVLAETVASICKDEWGK